jgi:hypothetical protein
MSEISSPPASPLLSLLTTRILGSMHPHQSEPKQIVTSWFCISYDPRIKVYVLLPREKKILLVFTYGLKKDQRNPSPLQQ